MLNQEREDRRLDQLKLSEQ